MCAAKAVNKTSKKFSGGNHLATVLLAIVKKKAAQTVARPFVIFWLAEAAGEVGAASPARAGEEVGMSSAILVVTELKI